MWPRWFRLIGFRTKSPFIRSHEHPTPSWWIRHSPKYTAIFVVRWFLLPGIFPKRNIFCATARDQIVIVHRCCFCWYWLSATRSNAWDFWARFDGTIPIVVTTSRLCLFSYSFFGVPCLPLSNSNSHFVVEISPEPCYFLRSLGVFQIGGFGQFSNDNVVGAQGSCIPCRDTHVIVENNLYQNKYDEGYIPTDFNKSSQWRGFLLVQIKLHHWKVYGKKDPRKA